MCSLFGSCLEDSQSLGYRCAIFLGCLEKKIYVLKNNRTRWPTKIIKKINVNEDVLTGLSLFYGSVLLNLYCQSWDMIIVFDKRHWITEHVRINQFYLILVSISLLSLWYRHVQVFIVQWNIMHQMMFCEDWSAKDEIITSTSWPFLYVNLFVNITPVACIMSTYILYANICFARIGQQQKR